MSSRNYLILPILVSSLALLASCGGNGVSIANPVPPPSGQFSNSNLNGTYVFSVSGTRREWRALFCAWDFHGERKWRQRHWRITGGTIDLNDAALSAPVANAAIASSSTYTVASGRTRDGQH